MSCGWGDEALGARRFLLRDLVGGRGSEMQHGSDDGERQHGGADEQAGADG
jgi:hypothetical protein